ncbi:MAG: glycosyltransferase [bacterium]|nr:glycosyltransferase [bacterium]
MSLTDTSKPRVSVVLPTFNRASMLPLSLESILNQTYQDYEVIVVDDGSTDGTAALLDSVQHPRLRVLYQENKRLPRALNAGFDEARGELLTWISSDNYCAPMFLEALVGALDAFPEAGFASSAFAWIDEQAQITRFTRDQDLSYRGFLCMNPGTASFMYRREIQEQVGSYAPELEGAEDWDMWLRLVERAPAVYVPEILYYYREHPNSMTGQMPERVFKASQTVFQQALQRAGNELTLAQLYPVLSSGISPDDEADACHDFGTRLLRSPFCNPELAAAFLEAAFKRRPDSGEIAACLAVACARSGHEARTRELCEMLGIGDPATLPVIGPDPQNFRALQEEQRREFSWTASATTEIGSLDAISFCIISAGQRPEMLDAVVESIRAQNIPNAEILVSGAGTVPEGARKIEAGEAAAAGRLGEMRNRAVSEAKHPVLVIMDDDILLEPGWYEGLCSHGPDFDILTSQLRVPDGSRYWDHATFGGPRGHCMLAPWESDEHSYMTGGGAWVMQRRVADAVHWDEQRAFYEEEDIDFSRRCREAGFRITHNSESCAIHADGSYTCIGRHTFRRSEDRDVGWLHSKLGNAEASEVLELANTLLGEGQLAEAADCIRFVIECEPGVASVRELWSQLEAQNGGALPDNRWSSTGDSEIVQVLRRFGLGIERSRCRIVGKSSAGPSELGFNVFGFLSGNLGLGVSARQIVRLLRESGHRVCPVDIKVGGGRADHVPFSARSLEEQTPWPVNLFILNPSDLSLVLPNPPQAIRCQDRVNVCLPFWELTRIPPGWQAMLESMDVVLAASRFIEGSFLASLSNVAVRYFPQPLFVDAVGPPDRAGWGLPEEATVFVTSFEMASDINRKNPFAAIEAFERTFAPGDNARLVVKVNNSHSCPSFDVHVRELESRAAARPDILILDRVLSYSEVMSLYETADVMVSLHRAEGLGLSLLEAMALGKPVIATGWSGNLDFMDDDNSCLVGHTLVPVHSTTQAAYLPEFTGPDAVWAEPSIPEAVDWMARLHDDPELRKAIGKRAGAAFARRMESIDPSGLVAAVRRAAVLKGLPEIH